MAKTTKKTQQKNTVSFGNSIKTKLIAVMIAVAAIPLVIALVISYTSSTSKALEDAQTALRWQAQYISSEFAGVIQSNVDLVRSIADDPTTIVYMEGTAGINDDVMIQKMQATDAILDDGSVMALADTTGMQIVRSGGKCVDVSTRDYFIEAMKGNLYLSNVLVSKSTGLRQLTIAAPIKGSDGKVLGEVQRNYDLESLHELLAAHTDDAFVLDRNGMMAAHAQFSIGAEEEYDMAGSAYLNGESGDLIDSSYGDKLIMSYYRDPLTGYTIVVSDNYKAVMSSAVRSALITVVIGIILLVVATIISFKMALSFTNPVQSVNDSLAMLADGRFAKVDKFENRKDEFGEMVRNTNFVISKLDEIVRGIKESSRSVGSSANDLSDMADQISHTTDDVATAVQEIATGATQQANEIQEANENVAAIGGAIAEVKSSAENLQDLAEKMQSASQVSSSSLTNLKESGNEMTTKIDEISSAIVATQNAVSSINEKVEGITSIATQTNLLSLNASIEAARAGEAGRGFAVVAEEIGKLADDSKRMADEIIKEMDVLMRQSKTAVGAADAVKETNLEQQSALDKTLSSVDGMLEDIASTVDGVSVISDGADVCNTSKNAVIDTMSALSAISEENAASSEETGASMEELSSTVTVLAESASALKNVADKLNADMSFFK
ncbi:MAG: methyl-accepting chemotaxis protein [Lachnospiraceae bacterium]|nr:methyl-accepting chemotaxis protein [Lachnospiraceae bacterium]